MTCTLAFLHQVGIGWMSGGAIDKLRYSASDEHGMRRWGWYRNDAGHLAQQQVVDPGNRLVSGAQPP